MKNVVPPSCNALYETLSRGELSALQQWTLPDPHWMEKARKMGIEPLIVAANAGHLDCVQWLIPRSDPRACDSSGCTALMRAVHHNRADLVEALRPHSHPEALDEEGKNALMIACIQRATRAIEALLADSAQPTLASWAKQSATSGVFLGKDALALAILTKNAPAVRLLLPHANLNWRSVDGETHLMLAARKEEGSVVRALLTHPTIRQGINALDVRGHTALMHAAVNGCAQCVEALLPGSEHEQLNHEQQSALDLAIKRANTVLNIEQWNEAWACVDAIAHQSSLEKAKDATKACPINKLPRLMARLEREALSKELKETARQGSTQGTQPTRRRMK